MRFTTLVKETIKKVRSDRPVLEGGHSIHIEMQSKGYDKALETITVSLMHAFNENENLLVQSAAVEFLRSENARLWDLRQQLISLKSLRTEKADQMAAKGLVAQSNEYEAETNNTVGVQIDVVNQKINGIRIALDHALHAGGDVYAERCIQPVMHPYCYNQKVYGPDYDKSVIIPIK